MKIANVLLKWNQQNNLDDYIIFNVNEFEYINNDLTLNWLYHFIRFTQNKRIKRYNFFIINEFDDHMTIQFNEFIIVNNIIFFKLSTHSTYITQSLNVEIF